MYGCYEDVIFPNYDRNQFVKKNENSKGRETYNFTFRGDEVSITFCNSQHSVLNICGKGQRKWLHEAVDLLNKQVIYF